ncbi:MAG TPA: hypothetical protein VFZ61_23045 [Polyangiales bacterium]
MHKISNGWRARGIAHRRPWLLISVWLAAATLSCVKTHESPELGTNTNWLKPCTEDGECKGGTSCLCGVCTLSCENDGQCGAVNAKTQCMAISADACAVAPAAPSACVQGCGANADCTSLERGLCVDGLCIPASAPGGSVPGAARYDLARRQAEVVITDAYTECSTDRDCRLVSTSCNSCCQVGAIHAALEATYEPNREAACADYVGGECDCDYPDVITRCDQGRCRTEPRSTEACFSPLQNLDRVAEPDAIGCRCPTLDEVFCSGGTQIKCTRENGLLRSWSVSTDGGC